MFDFLSLFHNKNVIHVSDSDLDGVASTALAIHYIEPVCTSYVPINTGARDMSEVPEDIFSPEVDIVLFTDIAPTHEFCVEIINNNKQIVIVDHHETSKEVLSDLDLNKHHYFYDDTICATQLLCNLITKDKREKRTIKRFVELVNIYDTWQENHKDWEIAKDLSYLKNKSINWIMNANDTDFIKNKVFIGDMVCKFEEDRKFFFRYNEMKKIKAEREKENKIYTQAKKKLQKRVDSKGNKFLYIECSSKVSIIGNKLLNENNDAVYALCRSTYYKAVQNRSLSLRSKGEFDVRSIAELYDGGGHLSASGFTARDDKEYKDLVSGIKTPI